MPNISAIRVAYFVAIIATCVIVFTVIKFSLFPQISTMTETRDVDTQVIIVGGGLAGLSAAIEASRHGAKVTIVEKEKSLGGNSAKATSGINGAESKPQRDKGINDSVDTFMKDTLSSGDGLSNPALVNILTSNSAEAIDFLRSFGVNLVDVVQLGGHSVPRTHRIPPTADGKPSPVGFTIVSTLRKYTENDLKESIQVLVNSAFKSLIFEGVRVVGIRYEAADKTEHELRGNVILTAGGYANDHSTNSLLDRYVPNLAKLPTTNGPWATGDIIKATVPNGLSLIHMDRVQVHPTGFVEPSNPNHHTKFLAPEALRGCGAIMLNAEGGRFVDELGRRDHVTDAIFTHCKHFQGNETMPVVAVMLFNDEAINQFGAASAGFYRMKGIIQDVGKLTDLADHLKVDASVVKDTLDLYKKAAETGRDEFGKVTFPVVFSPEDHFYLAYITPTLHYCMGGLKISEKAEVLHQTVGDAEEAERPVPGLYAAGEVTGGVHGNNRLGGNSLLECVVFGRVAGFHASHNRS